MEKQSVSMTVNGQRYEFLIGEKFGIIPPSETLVQTLRDRLQLTGSKESCDEGACGCCTVIKDGDAIASCMILTVQCDGGDIITIEGLEDPVTHELDPIQQKFIECYSFQCGYCTPGIIMSAKALFMKNPHPSAEEIREALSGNYCRCISHYTVLEALDKLAGAESDQYEIVNEAGEER